MIGLAIPTYSAYAASKGATEAITLIVARELRGEEITVGAIAPGPVETPLFLEGKLREAIDASARASPTTGLASRKTSPSPAARG